MVHQDDNALPYRKPALKRNWVISQSGSSVTFAPLTPGLRTFALHHISLLQKRLLALLKGEHTEEAIQEQLAHEFPSISAATVSRMLAQLDRAGLLEEADLLPPDDWAPEYLTRYTRNLAVFAGYERPGLSRFDQQRRIRNAHVVLLGAGGVGSWLAMLLGQLGVGHMTIADDDILTSSNLTRHALFTELDIGRNKAIAAADALHALNSDIEVTALPYLIETEEALKDIGQDVRLVIISFGPFLRPVPMQIHRACFRLGLPYVALSGLHLGPLVIPGSTACFACAQSFLASQVRWQTGNAEEGENSLLDRGYHAIFAPLVASCTGLGAMEVAKHITGFAPSTLANGLLYLNPTDLTLTRLHIPRDPTCRLCNTYND
ncbi:MAG TPA: ThiF family adenylyltransferase [Ktedonobacteraceae bacterium]|nr:ThiF family adenylyltransferase [Ktedonobacteraceae bacterium]